jgi:hypothetical protein
MILRVTTKDESRRFASSAGLQTGCRAGVLARIRIRRPSPLFQRSIDAL